jgi:DNA-binding response OmpR family regulator
MTVKAKLPKMQTSRTLGRVLVALDDEILRQRVTVALTLAGYAVVAGPALEALSRTPSKVLIGYDAFVFDADDRGDAGAALCSRLRECHVVVPQLVIASTADDLLACLEAGAIDGLVSPVRPRELVARVRTAIRHHAHASGRILQVGAFLFNPSRREIFQPEDRTPLILTEFETYVLKALHAAQGETVSRARLLQEIWDYHPHARTHTVETVIYRLRKKLEPGVKRYRLLETINGGYRLNALPNADEG